jgi:hypothetical protein
MTYPALEEGMCAFRAMPVNPKLLLLGVFGTIATLLSDGQLG